MVCSCSVRRCDSWLFVLLILVELLTITVKHFFLIHVPPNIYFVSPPTRIVFLASHMLHFMLSPCKHVCSFSNSFRIVMHYTFNSTKHVLIQTTVSLLHTCNCSIIVCLYCSWYNDLDKWLVVNNEIYLYIIFYYYIVKSQWTFMW